jgi:hypothetical protein
MAEFSCLACFRHIVMHIQCCGSGPSRKDSHHFEKLDLDPDPHQSGKLDEDPDPQQSEKKDPDPHQSEKV